MTRHPSGTGLPPGVPLPRSPSSPVLATLPDWAPCSADLNFDGLIDDSDFTLFAHAYDDLLTTDGDFTLDERTDDDDFSIFAAAYDALICP